MYHVVFFRGGKIKKRDTSCSLQEVTCEWRCWHGKSWGIPRGQWEKVGWGRFGSWIRQWWSWNDCIPSQELTYAIPRHLWTWFSTEGILYDKFPILGAMFAILSWQQQMIDLFGIFLSEWSSEALSFTRLATCETFQQMFGPSYFVTLVTDMILNSEYGGFLRLIPQGSIFCW